MNYRNRQQLSAAYRAAMNPCSPTYGQFTDEINEESRAIRLDREAAEYEQKKNCTHDWEKMHCYKTDTDNYHCDNCGMDLLDFNDELPAIGFADC